MHDINKFLSFFAICNGMKSKAMIRYSKNVQKKAPPKNKKYPYITIPT